MHSETTNMTAGNVKKVMLTFAMPVFLSQLFQQLYNTADSLIVGNLLGKQALAAVSSSSALIQLFTALMVGVALGAGVVISRYFGAGENETVSDAVHTVTAFGLVAGVAMTIVGVSCSPVLLRWMGTAPDVMEGSISYFRNYFLGSLAVMLYNVFTGIMNALGDSKRPLYYLIFSSVLNVLLDILFIGGFGFGVGSAATATAISQAASAFLCYLHLRKPGTIFQIRLRKVRFHKALMGEITRMGLPTGVQNSVISVGNVMVQSHINSFGSDAMAGCGTYAKLQGFAFLPIMSFAMAITTFVSQNLGAKNYDRARQGARFGIISMMVLAEIIGVILLVGTPVFARMFNSDPNVVQIAVTQARVENLFFFLLAFSHSIAGVCRGAGKATVPMLVMLGVWCTLRIVYITIAMKISHYLPLVFWSYPITWTVSSIIFLIYYLKSDWVHGFEHRSAHHHFHFH
ncbi:MAG: MATE family efflux transporter [Clostridia bacterium]|nr:MATE family efflux transporter [Clostridia bacterium]